MLFRARAVTAFCATLGTGVEVTRAQLRESMKNCTGKRFSAWMVKKSWIASYAR